MVAPEMWTGMEAIRIINKKEIKVQSVALGEKFVYNIKWCRHDVQRYIMAILV